VSYFSDWDKVERSARYGSNAREALASLYVIRAMHIDDDYQGSAYLVMQAIKKPDVCLYTVSWDWGSCSGCDYWEARNLTDEQISAEILNSVQRFKPVE
jgi:hypothetical protein